MKKARRFVSLLSFSLFVTMMLTVILTINQGEVEYGYDCEYPQSMHFREPVKQIESIPDKPICQ